MSFFSRLFRFRIFKFRTTLSEELEDLHSESTHLQQTLTQFRLIQRQWTRWFAIYAVLAYLLINASYYTFFLSDDYVTRVYAFVVSIAIAALLYGIHWTMRWYFRTMINMKQEKLALFKDRRQELIEEVKNKETYSVAKNLLERYGETFTPDARSPNTNGTQKDERARASIKPTVSVSEKPTITVMSPNPVGSSNDMSQIQTPVRGGPTRLAAGVTPGKLPRAILPPQRTFWGTMLDTVVGDGPSKRYALICRSCNSHNGMALEEEFEYLSFRCAYCNYFNGARKHKPVFNPDQLATAHPAPNGSTAERMDTSTTTDSSGSNDSGKESRVTRRSIRVAAHHNAESRSRSISMENKRAGQHHPALSSSEESLSAKKQ